MTFLSTQEAADLLRRSPAALRNLVMRQAIPFRKTGGKLLFIREELEQWIRESPGTTIDDLKKEGASVQGRPEAR